MPDHRDLFKRCWTRPSAIALGTCAIVAGILLFVYSPPKDPEYAGRTLSSWLEDLDHPAFAQISSEKRAAAENGIKQIGRDKAIPRLVWMLRRSEVPFRNKLEKWASKQSLFKIDFGPSIERIHWRAISGVRLFGTKAKAAVPALIDLLQSPAQLSRSAALSALGNLAMDCPEVLPHIVEAIEDTNPFVRLAAWQALGGVASRAKESLPRLMRHALDLDDETRSTALHSLCAITQYSTNLLPLLSESLTDKAVGVRGAAVFLLGQYGERARTTAPLIEKLLQDPVPDVRRTATNSLKAISGLAQNNKPPAPGANFRFRNVPVAQMLEIYATIVRKDLDIGPNINTFGPAISIESFGDVSANDVPRLIEEALLQQAGISLQVSEDGRVAVRRAGPAESQGAAKRQLKP